MKFNAKAPVPYTPRNVERYYCGECDLRLKKSWIICPRCATYILWDAQEIANLFYFKEELKKQMRGKKDEN